MKEYSERTVAFWNDYLAALGVRPEPDFLARRYATGTLPPMLAADICRAIRRAPEVPYHAKAMRCAFSTLDAAALAELEAGHTYKALDARTAWHLHTALAALREPVAAILRSPWRVLQVRSWISRHDARGGPYELHGDGEPREMLKIMAYWTPPGWAEGGLEVDVGGDRQGAIEGPAGTWVLFLNSCLMHRAVPPALGRERVATEITLCPWPVYDIAPRTLGANARHPMFPLVNEKDVL